MGRIKEFLGNPTPSGNFDRQVPGGVTIETFDSEYKNKLVTGIVNCVNSRRRRSSLTETKTLVTREEYRVQSTEVDGNDQGEKKKDWRLTVVLDPESGTWRREKTDVNTETTTLD